MSSNMKAHELLKVVVDKHGGVKSVAAKIGLSAPRVYQWTETPCPGRSGGINPLDRVAALIQATQDERIPSWICSIAQGFFVKNASPEDLTHPHLLKAHDVLVKEYAQMISLLITVISDGQVTEEESADLRRQWQSIQSVTESYIRECEKGTFRNPAVSSPGSSVPKASTQKR